MNTGKEASKPYGTVLIKAKEILDFLLAANDPPTLSDISRGLHSPKPTTLKILSTLETLGFVWRDTDSKRYFLGTHFIPYAQKALATFNIVNVARPFLEDLRDKTEETINLGIERNNKIILVEKLESPRSIKLQSTIGGSMNLYSSAMGKAVLATFSSKSLDSYFKSTKMVPMTPHTITTPSKLQKDLNSIKELGVSVDNEENEEEVFCLGASIVRDGQLYGAFSISAPKYRMPQERRSAFVRMLLDTKHAIESAI